MTDVEKLKEAAKKLIDKEPDEIALRIIYNVLRSIVGEE